MDNRAGTYELLPPGSQIEGTQASLEGVLEFEADLTPKDDIHDIKEVVNYVNALNYGIEKLNENSISSIYAVKMLDFLFDRPLVSTSEIVDKLNISAVSANELVKKFQKIGILREITGKKRYKKYFFANYVDIISRGTQNI